MRQVCEVQGQRPKFLERTGMGRVEETLTPALISLALCQVLSSPHHEAF